MKITHSIRCFTDRHIFGACMHDSKTGERVPFDVNMKINPEGSDTRGYIETNPSPWFAPSIIQEARAIIERGESGKYYCMVSWWFLKLLNMHYRKKKKPMSPFEDLARVPVIKKNWFYGTYRFIKRV